MRNPIYVSTEELPVGFGDPQPHADRRVLVIKDDLAAELETLAKSLNRLTLRDALRWLGERNAEYRIQPDAQTMSTTSATPSQPAETGNSSGDRRRPVAKGLEEGGGRANLPKVAFP